MGKAPLMRYTLVMKMAALFAVPVLVLAAGLALRAQAQATERDAPSRAAALSATERPLDWYPWLCRGRARCATRGPWATVFDRFAVLPGCRRLTYPRGSFADWVQHLPLLPEGAGAVDYLGQPLETRLPALALVDIDVFPFGKDWQQCADYGFRLCVEYLTRFRPRAGVTWRLQSGARYRFVPKPQQIRRHLNKIFAFLGSAGLKNFSPKIRRPEELRPGDMVVGNSTGAIGHAVVIHDIVECAGGTRRYLASQSWMPAQSPHVPRLESTATPGDYVLWEDLASFIRGVTGDDAAHLRRMPGCEPR
jgi:hypothetical protein